MPRRKKSNLSQYTRNARNTRQRRQRLADETLINEEVNRVIIENPPQRVDSHSTDQRRNINHGHGSGSENCTLPIQRIDSHSTDQRRNINHGHGGGSENCTLPIGVRQGIDLPAALNYCPVAFVSRTNIGKLNVACAHCKALIYQCSRKM